MRYITIKRENETTALEGNFNSLTDALDELKKTEHGTFTTYRTCPFDGHLVYLGEFCI